MAKEGCAPFCEVRQEKRRDKDDEQRDDERTSRGRQRENQLREPVEQTAHPADKVEAVELRPGDDRGDQRGGVLHIVDCEIFGQ